MHCAAVHSVGQWDLRLVAEISDGGDVADRYALWVRRIRQDGLFRIEVNIATICTIIEKAPLREIVVLRHIEYMLAELRRTNSIAQASACNEAGILILDDTVAKRTSAIAIDCAIQELGPMAYLNALDRGLRAIWQMYVVALRRAILHIVPKVADATLVFSARKLETALRSFVEVGFVDLECPCLLRCCDARLACSFDAHFLQLDWFMVGWI